MDKLAVLALFLAWSALGGNAAPAGRAAEAPSRSLQSVPAAPAEEPKLPPLLLDVEPPLPPGPEAVAVPPPLLGALPPPGVEAEPGAASVARTPVGGVGWSGSGFLLPYHVGVLAELEGLGVIVPGQTPMAGSSGGALVSAAACAGGDVLTMNAAVEATLRECASQSCVGSLDQRVRGMLERLIPQGDAWRRCDGRAFLHLTVLEGPDPCAGGQEGNWTVGAFTAQADLIDAAAGSAFLPAVSRGAACAAAFRGRSVIDGGYSEGLPCPPGAAAQHCLRISAYPKRERTAAEVEAEAAQATAAAAGATAAAGRPFASIPPADIYPGMRGLDTLPLPPAQFRDLQMDGPGALANRGALLALGRDDARAWARANGWL